jgi:Caulimovirus viroplasmin
MAQAATTPIEAPDTSPAPSLPLVANNTAAGTKRKRVVERKFYAVKEGKTPGIYNTWDECLTQVRGHRGALCTSPEALHWPQS